MRTTSSSSFTKRLSLCDCVSIISYSSSVAVVRSCKAQQMNRVYDRCERVSQLVGKHRQKFVLALAVREQVRGDSRSVGDIVDR